MADLQKITDDTVCNTTSIASALGLSVRRVQQLIQDGVIPTVSKGTINLGSAIQAYIKFLSKDFEKLDEDDVKIDKTKRAAEAQLKASKAQIAKLEAEELKGKMHRSEDVNKMTEDLVYSIRAALMALPGRVAVDISATPAQASEIVRKEVFTILRELAGYRYDEEKYMELVRERMNWESVGDDDE